MCVCVLAKRSLDASCWTVLLLRESQVEALGKGIPPYQRCGAYIFLPVVGHAVVVAVAEDELTEITSAITLLDEISTGFLFNNKDKRNLILR